jgi:hypothetical protein
MAAVGILNGKWNGLVDTNFFSNAAPAPGWYLIRVRGHLDDSLRDWFGGLTIENLENGEAVLAGRLADQAALFGVLERLHRLGIPVLSFNPANDHSPYLSVEHDCSDETK